jgi:hypothetical protein
MPRTTGPTGAVLGSPGRAVAVIGYAGQDRRTGGIQGGYGVDGQDRQDSKGVGTYAENTTLVVGARFHVVLVMGPDTTSGRNLVSRVATNVSQTYTPTA